MYPYVLCKLLVLLLYPNSKKQHQCKHSKLYRELGAIDATNLSKGRRFYVLVYFGFWFVFARLGWRFMFLKNAVKAALVGVLVVHQRYLC